jgi:signal peptidase I
LTDDPQTPFHDRADEPDAQPVARADVRPAVAREPDTDAGGVDPDLIDDSDDGPVEQETPPSTRKTVIEWVLLIGAALVIALIVKAFLFQAFYIPSDSMVPTLKTNDRVIVNKLSYKLHPVHRGDIIVF